MHILIIHQAFASLDEPGGTRHYEFACLLADRGHHVTVIASPVSYLTGKINPPGISKPEVQADGKGGKVRILRARVYAKHHKSFLHRMLAFFSFMLSSFILGLKVKRVDLVWATTPPIFQAFSAWTLARLKGVPVLLEVRDLWPEFAIAVGVLRNPILIRASEWLERFLYTHADRVLLNSPGFRKHVCDRGARQVEFIPNGADISMFDPADDGADIRRSLQLSEKFVALYAGAHGISNDLEVLLEAARLIMDETTIQFVLVGDGKEKPALQKQAEEMQLTNVKFLPPLPKSEMPHALAAADACIAILKPLEAYKTTYPNKVFDYMAAARPVILAIDGAIREVVEAAGCGEFVKPGNAAALADSLRKLAGDPQRARRMGINGRHYIEKHFNRMQMVAKLEMLLKEMVV